MDELFSDRHGYQVPDAEITVRYDAPENLRYAIPRIADNAGMELNRIREIVCNVLVTRPDRENNWSRPNVVDEIDTLLKGCYWSKIYDIAEALYQGFGYDQFMAENYTHKLNNFFHENGIGWEMVDGKIIFRGSEILEATVREATNTLQNSGRPRAAEEINKSLVALSLRPVPDLTGAINHATGALEATAWDITGLPNLELGKLISELNIPKPLDTAVEKTVGLFLRPIQAYSRGPISEYRRGRADCHCCRGGLYFSLEEKTDLIMKHICDHIPVGLGCRGWGLQEHGVVKPTGTASQFCIWM